MKRSNKLNEEEPPLLDSSHLIDSPTITDINSLKKSLAKKHITLSDKETKNIEEVIKKYPMRISPYYF